MDLIQLTDSVHILHGAVNMGLVRVAHGLVAIDTGLDKQSGKQLLKAAQTIGQPIVGIINTHAHADHFGGNATVLGAGEIPVYAPIYEADVIRRPQYEPEYLWHGAKPLPALLNKFLQAPASPVTHEFTPASDIVIGDVKFHTVSLPGHSLGQAGVIVDDVFFAADAYFSADVSRKHGIPFMVDYEQTLASAEKVCDHVADWYVPGHGPALDQAPHADVSFLTERHQEAYGQVVSTIQSAGTLTLDALMTSVCRVYDVVPSTLGAYVLFRAPISAFVTAAVEHGLVEVAVEAGVPVLRAIENML